MKISELINDLAQIYGKEGDIDVVCVTPIDPDFGTEPPCNKNRLISTTTGLDREFEGITTDKYLFIGMH
jgi:hypothetical protein